MINFANGTVFNLKPIDMKSVNQNALRILIDGEQPLCAFKTVRDQVLFTNKRIITVDVQGVTGKRQEVSTLPYSKVLPNWSRTAKWNSSFRMVSWLALNSKAVLISWHWEKLYRNMYCKH